MRTLFLVRGLPGSGKSTLARRLAPIVVEADQYWTDPETGDYKFDRKLLPAAHKWCRESVDFHLSQGKIVAVANTFVKKWEMKPYFKMAEKYGYRVTTIIVENRHGSESIHGQGAIDKCDEYRDKFEVVL